MILPLPQPLFLLGLALAFTYFMLAGARTFERDDSDDFASGLAQFSFLCTGALATWFIGRGVTVYLWNGALSAILLAAALTLYEWARHTIRNRKFHIAWSGDVPEELCERGPYRFIRHPVYLSYILAFAAQMVALPMGWTALIFVFNAALYGHAAFSDERSLTESALAAPYTDYRRRVGMFFPRFK